MVGDDLKMRHFQIKNAQKDLMIKIAPKLKTQVAHYE